MKFLTSFYINSHKQYNQSLNISNKEYNNRNNWNFSSSHYENSHEQHERTIFNNNNGMHLSTSHREGNSHGNKRMLEYRNCNWIERNRSVLNSCVHSHYSPHQSNHNVYSNINEGNSLTTFDSSSFHNNRGSNAACQMHHTWRKNDKYHLTSLDGNSRTTRFGSNHDNVTLVNNCNSSVGGNIRMGSVSLDSGRGGFHDRFANNNNTGGSFNYIQNRYEHQKSQLNHCNREIPEKNNCWITSNSAGRSNRGNQNQSLTKGTHIGNDLQDNNRNYLQEVWTTSLIGNSYSIDTSMLNDVQDKNEKYSPQNNVRTSLIWK